MTITEEKIAELRRLLQTDLMGLSGSGIASIKWSIDGYVPDLLIGIERLQDALMGLTQSEIKSMELGVMPLLLDGDETATRVVKLVVTMSDAIFERDKYRAIAVKLAGCAANVSLAESNREKIDAAILCGDALEDPSISDLLPQDIRILLTGDDHG